MKTKNKNLIADAAFTLIELLVVIAIIGTLAGMLFPVLATVKIKQQKSVARTELKLIEAAIESYKLKYNTYPPCNPNGIGFNAAVNGLYYELSGVTATTISGSPGYQTLDSAATIKTSEYNATYSLGGIVNTTLGSGEDQKLAKNFFPGLKANMIGAYTNSSLDIVSNLVTSIGGPFPSTKTIPPGFSGNPFRYAFPGTNNPNSYDLWVELYINKTNFVIGNWTDR